MRQVVVKSTYGTWAAAFVLFAGLACAAIWVAGGCSKSVEPSREKPAWHDGGVLDNENVTVVLKVAPVNADTAMFTLIDQYGSEIRVKVWRSGDSLLCPMSGLISWQKWLSCVDKQMDMCDRLHPDDSDAFWECVAISAAGCSLGVAYMDFVRFVFIGWSY